jgi:tetratricopeptide (TPR) repeat protein
MINVDINKSIEYSRQAIDFAGKSESGYYEKGFLDAKKNLSIAYSLSGKYTESLKIIQEILPRVQSKKEYAEIYLNLLHSYGHTLRRTANFPEALDQLIKALRTAEQLKDSKLQSRSCDAIAAVYGMMEDFGRALEYFNKALEYAADSLRLAEQEKIERLLPHVLDTLGEAYMNLEMFDQALTHLDRALDLARRNRINDAEVFILLNLGHTYRKVKDIYAEEVINTIIRSIPGLEVELRVDIADISLPSSMATTIGLIINELVTNAVKHAFDPSQKNEFSIQFKDEEQYVLTQTNSSGTQRSAVNFDNPNSLGLRLINALTGQLNGELVTRTGDTFTVEISFPK